MSEFPLRVAILISGGGTTLKNLIELVQEGELNIEICVVISSSPKAGGIAFSKEAGIPTHVVQRKSCALPEAFRDAIFSVCRASKAQLVVMGGFLKHLLIPPDFEGRVLNIHPSLIPAFCGRGFYGRRVHEAVLEAGVAQSGCTVHVVDNEYDHGPIILQRTVPVRSDDTPDSLAARIFQEECQALPAAIRRFAAQQSSTSESS